MKTKLKPLSVAVFQACQYMGETWRHAQAQAKFAGGRRAS